MYTKTINSTYHGIHTTYFMRIWLLKWKSLPPVMAVICDFKGIASYSEASPVFAIHYIPQICIRCYRICCCNSHYRTLLIYFTAFPLKIYSVTVIFIPGAKRTSFSNIASFLAHFAMVTFFSAMATNQILMCLPWMVLEEAGKNVNNTGEKLISILKRPIQ